uniref:Uncharacterized protein n=1 Tax=Monopterus albus TaxID=43700 RepID=A0A3Q3JIC6_MONAL
VHGQQDPLHILTVQPVMGTSDVDLLLAMERAETSGNRQMGGFYSQQELSAKLEEAAARGQIRGVLAGAVVVSSACSGALDCGDKVCEQTLVMEGGSPVTYSTERVSLVAPRFSRTETCICPGGTCPTHLELCEGQTCPADMQCVRSGPTAPSVCQCQPERLDECAGQTSLSFSGNSYIKYRVTESGQSGEMRLSLRIRTLQRRGVIMFTRVNPCTMLKIEGGRLWFQLDCDNTLGIMGISDRAINDGLWHAIALELTRNYTLLSLDDSYVERRRAARAPVRLWPLDPDSSFFFGAQVRPLNGAPPRAQDGFQGCLSSLMLNSNDLPLQNKRSRYAEIAGLNEVKLGCVLYPDPCVSQPCLNGAICSSLPSGGFICSCSAGFTGGYCEIELTSCMSNPCQNGGHCSAAGSAFLCGCPPGLGGLICDEDLNECDQGECHNGGECVNTFGSFYCNCSEGYKGPFCDDQTPEAVSYIGPGEIIGIGVLAFVIILLLILFIAFRKKIKFRKDSDPGPGTQALMGVSAISTETSYMLHKTGTVAEGIEFKAVRVSGLPGTTSTYAELGDSTGGPPQVMVRPTTYSPLPGSLCNQGMTGEDGEMSNFRGVVNRRGVAVCSVAPNLPAASASLHSACCSIKNIFVTETIKNLVLFFPAYHCESSSWLSPSRLSPPELGSHCNLGDTQQNIRRGGSMCSLQLDYRVQGYGGDRGQQQGWETGKRTFQWERNQSGEWERKCILDSEETRRHDGEGMNTGNRSRNLGTLQDHRDLQQLHSCEDGAAAVYEEYRECSHDPEQSEDTDSLYDTLPPTRQAYEGYPSSPPSLNLQPAQLLPPLRAWDLQMGEWRGSQDDRGGLGSSNLGGSGDELERLLNLVSLRTRRATQINRASTGSEPATGWDEFK